MTWHVLQAPGGLVAILMIHGGQAPMYRLQQLEQQDEQENDLDVMTLLETRPDVMVLIMTFHRCVVMLAACRVVLP